MPTFTSSNSTPAEDAVAITPSDSTNLLVGCRAIYVGGAGDVTGITRGGNPVTFKSVLAGSVLPVGFSRINATATTATFLLALY